MKGTAGASAVTQIEKALYLNDPDKLQEALRSYMMSCISSFDGSAEGFCHTPPGILSRRRQGDRHFVWVNVASAKSKDKVPVPLSFTMQLVPDMLSVVLSLSEEEHTDPMVSMHQCNPLLLTGHGSSLTLFFRWLRSNNIEFCFELKYKYNHRGLF